MNTNDINNEINIVYRLGTKQDLDAICLLISQAINEMEKHEIQNKGLGKKVLLHVEEQIKEMGYQSVRLDAFTENPFAQKLYLHNGYESRGYANWRKGKFDLMEKKLI